MRFIKVIRQLCLGTGSFLLLTIAPPDSSAQGSGKSGQYDKLWSEADAHMETGMPQSALKIVEEIYADAIQKENSPEVIRAIIYRISINSSYQEDITGRSLEEAKKELALAKDPAVRALLESMIAEIYLAYYRSNSWLYYDREATSGYEEPDFRLWGLNRLASEIMKHYRSSLSEPGMLQSVDLTAYNNILHHSPVSKIYRPTLYDFLAHRALSFYSSTLAGLSRPAEQFQLDNPVYLGANEFFAKLDISTADTMSLLFRAIKLYQDLTRFHMPDGDPRALLELTLARLKFVKKNASNTLDANELYLVQLESLSEQFKGHNSYPLIRHRVAETFFEEGSESVWGADDPKRWNNRKALEICREAVERYPAGEGADDCRQLMAQIEATSLSVLLPEVHNPGDPMLFSTDYKNIKSIYYRIIRVDPSRFLEMKQKDREEFVTWITGQKALFSWQIETKDPGDYRAHRFEYGTPQLQSGYYVMLAASDPAFSPVEHHLAIADFQVSSIALLSRTNPDGSVTLYLHDRKTGTPLPGIRVIAKYMKWDFASRKYAEALFGEFTSDREGMTTIKPAAKDKEGMDGYLNFLMITPKGDSLHHKGGIYVYPNREQEEKVTHQTWFFLDRAIYRPGQTLFFKGITIRKEGKELKAAAGQKTFVKLLDNHGKVLSTLQLVTNEFGSFQGSFVLPSSGLLGEMGLQVEHGSCSFLVEEYKRPKFAVKMLPIKGTYTPGDEVTVEGKSEAFAGFNLTDAKVTWRVTRGVQYPYSRSFGRGYYPWYRTDEVEIAQGTGTTDADGVFRIRFNALPDPKISREKNPVFLFTVYADVTDLNGETHSASSIVKVGYTMVILSAEVPAEVQGDSLPTFPIKALNLNGEPVQTKGTWTLYRVEPPKAVTRERIFPEPDTWLMEEAVFRRLFPHDMFRSEEDAVSRRIPVSSGKFNTDSDSDISPIQSLKAFLVGRYELILEIKDQAGNIVKDTSSFILFLAGDKSVPEPVSFRVKVLNNIAEPGETVTILVGSSEKTTLRYTLELNGKILEERWIALKGRQQRISIPIAEEYRGGLAVRFTGVHLNRPFRQTEILYIPWSNKELDISFSSFRDKLQPGEEEEYRITVKGPGGEQVLAELLAGMYDLSLDQFAVNRWEISPYPQNRAELSFASHGFGARSAEHYGRITYRMFRSRSIMYDQLNWFGFNLIHGYIRGGRQRHYYPESIDADGSPEVTYLMNYSVPMIAARGAADESSGGHIINKMKTVADSEEILLEEDGSLSQAVVSPPAKARTNFNETAFFYPQLKTDDKGNVVFSYRVPESLTAWKLMLLAHTPDLKSAIVEKQLVTQKELMVIPNAPRFFREGDRISFTAKVTNLSDQDQLCTVVLKLTNGLTGKEMDNSCGNHTPEKEILVRAGQSDVVTWQLSIPEQAGAITYNVTAVSARWSDGEEMTIPVLSNRMLVTESLPIWVTGRQTKSFSMEKLLKSGSSSTLRHHKLTLEYTSNPAWYAIQALPYLMEFPYECSEQLFSRFYANSMATHIANSNPKIRQVFEAWKSLTPDALLSNLEKNQELKALLLEETPWLMAGRSESERKQRVALLFDLNRMANEMGVTLEKLGEQQAPNGGWPWFKGGPDSWYITQHIATGLGRLNALGITSTEEWPDLDAMASRAVVYLDKRLEEHYNHLKKIYQDKPAELAKNHLSQLTVMYLYTRSWYLKSHTLEPSTTEAFDWLQQQAVKYWTNQDLMMQGYLALALHRLDKKAVAVQIMKSIKERSLFSEEMGRYWRSNPGYFWYDAPVERQAILIEAFTEVTGEMKMVEEMKLWLLKQKQTQDWKTTKATAEACYALMLRGTDLLASSEIAQITMGGQKVDPYRDGASAPEAGTGYFKVSWEGSEVTPGMGNVSVTSTNDLASWGALYWQYFDQLDKITPHQTPLQLKKQLFVEENTPSGVVIKPLGDNQSLKVGDRVVVRIELRVDRDMEYVHMKDMRASAFEPLATTSGYRWQGGLGYYESPRDAAVNFFFDYLRKGTYLFEYKLHATHAGEFSNGITTIQCMYAPEFSSHSEGRKVIIEN
jgi:hypothetical protein